MLEGGEFIITSIFGVFYSTLPLWKMVIMNMTNLMVSEYFAFQCTLSASWCWKWKKWHSLINYDIVYLLEKTLAPHSSTLAWKIPWMEEPGRLLSMGSLRVGHDWETSLSLFTFLHWRRKWQPTPVFLPGESQEWGSLVGCHLWGHTESDTTEVT